jgi:thymidylate kinase
MSLLSLGIEGPVLAGKSTVSAALALRFESRGIRSIVAPDFADAARLLGLTLPSICPRDRTEEMSAVEFFLEVDRLRRPLSKDAVVILDRTCWTLIAHANGLAAVGGVNAVADVQQCVALNGLVPHALVYLDVTHGDQLSRSQSRGPLPALLLDGVFNAAFREAFNRSRTEHGALWVEAGRSLQATVNSVDDYFSGIICSL